MVKRVTAVYGERSSREMATHPHNSDVLSKIS